MKLDLSIINLERFVNEDVSPFSEVVLDEILNMRDNDFLVLCTFLRSYIIKKEETIKNGLINYLGISNDHYLSLVKSLKFTQSYIHDNHIISFLRKLESMGVGPDHRFCKLLVETGVMSMERLYLMMNQFVPYRTRCLSEELTGDDIDGFLTQLSIIENESILMRNKYVNHQMNRINDFFRSPIYERISGNLKVHSNSSLMFFYYTYHSITTEKSESEIIYLTGDEDYPLIAESSGIGKREVILNSTCAELFGLPAPGQFDDIIGVMLYRFYSEFILSGF